MSARLLWLFVRSRRAGVAVICLIGVAAVTWLFLDLSGGLTLTELLLSVMPLGTAVVIGTSARSAFGEAERTASFSLPMLRLGHLGALLACAAAVLIAANTAAPADATATALVRNAAGYAGLALLGARLLGAGLAWMPPLAYGTVVFVARYVARVEQQRIEESALWMWPVRAATDGSARTLALALLVAGLTAAVSWGARDEPGEVS